ncbi:hypothetical protein C8R48DRAFT_680089 [Suillus tomentosus]|nr:hypothetical protein C8R48DRAFT_680089 [Suillus tomentosus]
MTDGPGGKLFPMEADGWAEVVGYNADGCIKVDVYQIEGHDGAEVVVHQPNQRRTLNPGVRLVFPYEKPSSDHRNSSEAYQLPSAKVRVPSSGTQDLTQFINTFRVKWPTKVEIFLKRAGALLTWPLMYFPADPGTRFSHKYNS